MPPQKRKAVSDLYDMSSDEDFQPSLYHKRQRRKKDGRKTRGNHEDKIEAVSSQRRPVVRHRRTKVKSNKATGTSRETARVVLQRVDAEPGKRYLLKHGRSEVKDKQAEGHGDENRTKRVYKKSVISLPPADKMVHYSQLDGKLVNFDNRKRNLGDVIDSSDDEQILIKGKPSRKKYKKEELSESFLECFYLSSSDESSVIDTSSDSDIFASSGDDEATKNEDPSERQKRYMKRDTLRFHRFTWARC